MTALRQPQNNGPELPDPDRNTIVSMPSSITRDAKPITDRIGDILKRERERRGDDLDQIADYLRIRRSYLMAIENSQYDKFPADAYVIGFLRSYAELLGLDGKEVIDYYRREMAGRRKKPTLSMPSPISEGRAPSAIILVGAGLAALALYACWYAFSTSDRASVSVQPALPATVTDTVVPASPETVPANVAPASGSSAATAPTNIATTNAATAPEPATPVVAPIAPTQVVTDSKPVSMAPAAHGGTVLAKDATSGIQLAAAAPPPSTLADNNVASATASAPAVKAVVAKPVVSAAVEPAVVAKAEATNGGDESADALNARFAPPRQTAPTAIVAKPVASAAAASATPAVHLTIRARQASWILVSDRQGHTVYDKVMKVGEVYTVPDMPGLTLTTGNGAGVALTLDGKPLPRLSNASSQIMRNIPLDDANLHALPAEPND